MSQCCLCETNLRSSLSLPQRCMMMMRMIAVCVSLSLSSSLPLSVSTACHSWILWIYPAAILVTQLTTPYLRIAPAAGDNQLTGQICGCADAQSASHLSCFITCACCSHTETNRWLLSCCFQRQKSAGFDQSLDNILCLHLLVITAHERLVGLWFDVTASLAGVNPLSWLFLIISGIVCIVTGGDNQKRKSLRVLHLNIKISPCESQILPDRIKE